VSRVREIRVIESLWSEASALRSQEWRTLISDLLDEDSLALDADQIVIAPENGFVLASDEARIEIPDAVLAPHIAEYVAIMKKMIEDDIPAPRLEALDMAKKVVHDAAARALAEHSPNLARGHEGFRRLFTLLVALRVDTTHLPGAHRYRK